MYSFATLEFQSMMLGYPQFQPVVAKGKHSLTGDVVMIMCGSDSQNKLEYVSPKGYITFTIYQDGMHLKMFSVGEAVVDANFTDFNDVRDLVRKFA